MPGTLSHIRRLRVSLYATCLGDLLRVRLQRTATVLLVGALTYIPGLAFGPIAEHLQF